MTQWLAPWHVLGKSGQAVRVKRELVIATSDGKLKSVLDQLEAVLDEALSDISFARPAPAAPGPELNLGGLKDTRTWNPLVLDDLGRLGISVDGVTAAVRDAD